MLTSRMARGWPSWPTSTSAVTGVLPSSGMMGNPYAGRLETGSCTRTIIPLSNVGSWLAAGRATKSSSAPLAATAGGRRGCLARRLVPSESAFAGGATATVFTGTYRRDGMARRRARFAAGGNGRGRRRGRLPRALHRVAALTHLRRYPPPAHNQRHRCRRCQCPPPGGGTAMLLAGPALARGSRRDPLAPLPAVEGVEQALLRGRILGHVVDGPSQFPKRVAQLTLPLHDSNPPGTNSGSAPRARRLDSPALPLLTPLPPAASFDASSVRPRCSRDRTVPTTQDSASAASA